MDFEKKYGTKFWTLVDELTETTELTNELADYALLLENLKKREQHQNESEELIINGMAEISPEKERQFRELAYKACHMAEICAADIAVMTVAGKRGCIELKSDAMLMPMTESRDILSKLINSADDIYIYTLDGEVRIKLYYELFSIKYNK